VNSMASSRTRSRQVGARKKPKRRTPINAIDESTTHQIRMKRCWVVPFGRSAFECNLGSKRCATQVVCVGVGWGVESPQGTLPFLPLLPPPTVALQAPARFHTIYSARAAFSRGTGISRNEFSHCSFLFTIIWLCSFGHFICVSQTGPLVLHILVRLPCRSPICSD
jgi:hypothetical protein